MTDGSPLSKEALQRSWAEGEHPLGVLHVSKDVTKLILDGGRAIQNRRKRQGNTGRKKRRGRPSKPAQHQSQRREGMSKKPQASGLWEPQYLIGRTPDDLSEQAKENRALLLQIAPARPLFRPCHQQLYRLFAKGITKQWARSRRTRRVHPASSQANALLAHARKKIGTDKCDKMLVLLGWENGQRTNHHVERNTRVLRMRQKTRYNRRKIHTMTKALELEL
jgi:hypothetical protein